MIYDEFVNVIVTADVLCREVNGSFKIRETQNSYILKLKIPNSLFWQYPAEVREEFVFLLHKSKFFSYKNETLQIYYDKE